MSSPEPMDQDPPSAAEVDEPLASPVEDDKEEESDKNDAASDVDLDTAHEPRASTSSPPAQAASPHPSSPAKSVASNQESTAPASEQGDGDVNMAGSAGEGAEASDAGGSDGERGASGGEEGSAGEEADEQEEGEEASMSFKKNGKGSSSKESGGEASRKKKKRRKDSPSPSPEREGSPIPVMTEQEEARIRLNQRIDAIVKKPKSRRKAKGDDDDLDQMADDMIQNLKDRMLEAADRDEAYVHENKDATAKEAMLQDVVNVLQQSTLLQSIVDNDLLSAVRRWLEPLPDRSLPSLDIQRAFLEILVKMDIDTPTLKSCGLGKIIIFYTKSRRSTLRVKRLAERLQLNWLRPLVKSSSSYRTKKVVEVDVRDRKPLPRFKSLQDESKRSKREESLTPGGEKSEIKAQSIGNKRKGARIPMSSSLSFTVAPRFDSTQPSQSSQGGGNQNSLESDMAKRVRDQERLRKVKNRLNEARRAEKT